MNVIIVKENLKNYLYMDIDAKCGKEEFLKYTYRDKDIAINANMVKKDSK